MPCGATSAMAQTALWRSRPYSALDSNGPLIKTKRGNAKGEEKREAEWLPISVNQNVVRSRSHSPQIGVLRQRRQRHWRRKRSCDQGEHPKRLNIRGTTNVRLKIQL